MKESKMNPDAQVNIRTQESQETSSDGEKDSLSPGEKKSKPNKVKLPTLTHPEQNTSLLKQKGVSIVAFLDTVRTNKKGGASVRMQIIYQRFPKLYSTRIQMLPDDWLKIIGPKARGDLKEKKIIIYELLRKALDIIYKMEVFSFESFDKQFYTNQKAAGDVFLAYEGYLKILKENERLGSENMYRYSMNSIKQYHNRSRLLFKNITIQFLRKYENHMTLKGKSLTTIAMYLRCLRYLYNEAIKEGIIKQEDYPFGRGKYEIPQPQNRKKALKLVDIGRIYKYVPDNQVEHFYRDIWLFSYFCNGINMKDICLLKYSNIHRDHIHYRRAKTIHSNRNSKPIDIIITDDVRQIIESWGNKPVEPGRFIFPFLNSSATAQERHASIKQAIWMTNKYIKKIASKVGVDGNISTYTARHSYATVLKRSGVNISFISEALGHTDIKTTENYLDSFEDEQMKEVVKKLTDW